MSQGDAELLQAFREELEGGLDDFATALERIERGEADPKRALNAAFRTIHNVKGAARMVGVEPIVLVTHAIEDALSPLRESGQPPGRDLTRLMLQGAALIEKAAAGAADPEAVAALVRRIGAAAGSPTTSAPAPKRQRSKRRPVPKAPGQEEAATAAPPAASAPADLAPAADTSVRVEISRLDRLMGSLGELLVSQARQDARAEEAALFLERFQEACASLAPGERERFEALATEAEHAWLGQREDARRFGYLTGEIGAAMKRVRMLPVAGLVAQWRRIVRDAARALGKEVRLDTEVGDIELDKRILDELRDPLMHLLRNAVFHGIEKPDSRARLGKHSEGRVLVRAGLAGASVRLEVGDDGRGIDPSAVREAAQLAGLLSPDDLDALSDEGLTDLVFSPGLSTTVAADEFGGRGVGLDVVRQRVRGIGGSVAVVAPSLGGTSVELIVPASLVSTRGLLVRAGEAVVAIPIENVERALRVEAAEVEQVGGGAAVRVGSGEPLRLRWLAAMLGQSRGAAARRLTVVVVRGGPMRAGLVVDALVGEEEFVAKTLPWNLAHAEGVSGAVILGNGVTALVLDPRYAAAAGAAEDEAAPAEEQRRAPVVLVVDDSLTSRTLERNILRAAGYEVIVTVDGEEGWAALQETAVDLVVADIQMPGLNGLELTRRIRGDPRTKNLPVVLMTGLDSPDDVAAGAAAGADDYLTKGRFDQGQLLAAVARHV